jgi:hypothetical protein
VICRTDVPAGAGALRSPKQGGVAVAVGVSVAGQGSPQGVGVSVGIGVSVGGHSTQGVGVCVCVGVTDGGTVKVVVGVTVLVGVLVGGQPPLHGVFVGVAVRTIVAVAVTVAVTVAVAVVRSFLQSCTVPTGPQRAASLELGCRGERYSPATVAASARSIAPRNTNPIRGLVTILQHPARLRRRSYAYREQMSIDVPKAD